jgi:hypothetical protein
MGPMIRHRSIPALLLIASIVGACTSGGRAPGATHEAMTDGRPSPGPAGAPSMSAHPGSGDRDTAGGPPAVSVPSLLPASRPPPSPTAPPSPTPPPPTEAFAMNLYRRGDYVAQYTFEWCVGASMQMTLNMATDRDDRTRARQQELWEMARDRSFSPFGGASPVGWTKALNDVGAGPYELVSVPDLDGALRTAAAAIRATGRPVGLVMWSGRHAWMMSGFTSLGDPAKDAGFRVTGVRVLDPLHPHGSRRWGPSPAPNALVDPAVVGEQFVARLGGRVDLGVAPGYLLILPRPTA